MDDARPADKAGVSGVATKGFRSHGGSHLSHSDRDPPSDYEAKEEDDDDDDNDDDDDDDDDGENAFDPSGDHARK